MNKIALIVIFMMAVIVLNGCGNAQDEQYTPTLDAITTHDRGVALMGQFDYAAAFDVFDDLVSRYPEWERARVSWIIAMLNRQQPGDEERARTLVTEMAAQDPANLAAHYIAGLLHFNIGQTEQAKRFFQHVVHEDATDAFAHYYLGQSLVQSGDNQAAMVHFREAIALDAYLRSAYYGLFQALQRAGDMDGAREALADYQKLDGNPRARLAEIKYTKMGPKAQATVIQHARQEEVGAIKSLALGPAQQLLSLPEANVVGIFHSYVRHDSPEQFMLLLFSDTTMLLRGSGQDWTVDAGFPTVSDVNVAAFGDADNDGDVDLYLARDGANMYLQQDDGVFTDLSATVALNDGDHHSSDALWFDADHDGDLDLMVVNRDGPSELYNNNRDGSFRRLAAQIGMDMPLQGVLVLDQDGDLDTDILTMPLADSPVLWLNDRLWRYQPQSIDSPGPWRTAVALDSDNDGSLKILAQQQDGEWQFVTRTGQSSIPEGLPKDVSTGLWAMDVDADGRTDLLVRSKSGISHYVREQDRWQASSLAEVQPHAALYLTQDASLVWHEIRESALYELPVTGGGNAIHLRLTGLDDKGQGMRSNASGVGTRIAARSAAQWTVASTYRNNIGPGQSHQSIRLGLAQKSVAEFVELDWTDGVYQTELGLSAGQTHSIRETQRQLASCPVLFAWNGTGFVYISDVLGVGGIGFATGPGSYAQPRPWEYFQVSEHHVGLRDGQLVFMLTEPMQEVAYVDQVQLQVVDVPPGRDLILDERMGTAEPLPTGKPLIIHHSWPLVDAEVAGVDVLESLLLRDDHALSPGVIDSRFLGLLKEELVLEFSIDADIDPNADYALELSGWVEYGYSQTSFAAWQAGVQAQPFSLEALTPSGQWQSVYTQFGYPAGMPRRASLPISAEVAAAQRLRLRTNQEIYLDQLQLHQLAQSSNSIHQAGSLRAANVSRVGFPKRSNLANKRPSYDFENRSQFWDTRYQQGYHTAFGAALPLVRDEDNALAIIGPGDGLELMFAPPKIDKPEGWTRHYILYFKGWAKDMDMFTNTGDTIAPLPYDMDVPGDPAMLHQQFNTRFQDGKS